VHVGYNYNLQVNKHSGGNTKDSLKSKFKF